MNKNPLVSIITPSFNQGKFIRETIESVLNQDYRNIEYIVMDGGSTDETVKILKSYGKRLKWFSKKDKGQMDALNKGLKMIHGEIIAFINSDDFYLPNTIKKVVEYVNGNPGVDIVSGDCTIINSEGKRIQSLVSLWKILLRKIHSFNTLCTANYIIQPSTFWRSGVYKRLGDFDENLHYVFDYEYWLRAYKNGYKIEVIDDVFTKYRIHSQSKGGAQYKKRCKEELIIAKKYNKSIFIYGLHYIHNWLTVFIYNFIQ